MDVDLSSLQVASEAKERGGAFVTVNGRMVPVLKININIIVINIKYM